MTEDDHKSYYKNNTCHICKRKILEDSDKVRDHDHVTGKFMGPAHNKCNLKRNNKITRYL